MDKGTRQKVQISNGSFLFNTHLHFHKILVCNLFQVKLTFFLDRDSPYKILYVLNSCKKLYMVSDGLEKNGNLRII